MIKNAQQIQALINELFLFGDGSFDDFDTKDLFALLVAADKAYYDNDAPILEDAQYDALRRYLEVEEPNNSYFLGVGSEVRGGKVKLPHTMGSLTQAYEGDTQKWIKQYQLEYQKILITEKLDGISCLIVYDANGNLQIAYSRGDGYEGADITRHVSKIASVPKNVGQQMTVRAEIIFAKNDWDIVKTKIKRSGGSFYKNARNATAGLMNASQSDPLAYQYLSVVAYEIVSGHDYDTKNQVLDKLDNVGFITPVSHITEGWNCDDKFLTALLTSLRSSSKYEIDGIVLEVDSAIRRNAINPTRDTLNPEYARKFKVADASNLAVATVTQVEWRVSKNGYLKPRVHIEPVELVGVTVQHATGFNAKFIRDNRIGPGAKVRITRSGDVIPFILGVVEQMTNDQHTYDDWLDREFLKIGENYHWSPNKVDVILDDANDNETVKFEQLKDFGAKLGIEYIGEGHMRSIFDAGYTTPTDFVKMMASDIALAIGSQVVAKKIQQSKMDKLTNVAWWVVAGAHPCFGRGIGQRKMKKLYEAYNGDITVLSDAARISQTEGFDTKTANKIVAGYETFTEFVEDCGSAMSFSKYEAPKQGGLSGQSFLFTGFRDKGLEKLIEAKGGKVSSSVSSKLTYLVAANPNETSGKLTKARQIGTKIITREQLMEILGA